MIIKSHIRGGYRAAADYLKEIGKNEEIRLVQISDPDAKNLDEAFHNMWAVACNGKVKKPLHHISINPFKDERLTDEQVLKIVARAEQKYGYKPGEHQRVIVEHILNGRQHFHVMWNRVSLKTGKAVWPGHHWNKSKQVCREMEKEMGLKSPVPRRKHVRRMLPVKVRPFSYPLEGRKTSRLMLYALLNPPPPYWILPQRRTSVPKYEVPQRPSSSYFPPIGGGSLSGMCEAQRIDFIAACSGRITWGEYFEKWGDGEVAGPGW